MLDKHPQPFPGVWDWKSEEDRGAAARETGPGGGEEVRVRVGEDVELFAERGELGGDLGQGGFDGGLPGCVGISLTLRMMGG